MNINTLKAARRHKINLIQLMTLETLRVAGKPIKASDLGEFLELPRPDSANTILNTLRCKGLTCINHRVVHNGSSTCMWSLEAKAIKILNVK